MASSFSFFFFNLFVLFFLSLASTSTSAPLAPPPRQSRETLVLQTAFGDLEIKLWPSVAPVSFGFFSRSRSRSKSLAAPSFAFPISSFFLSSHRLRPQHRLAEIPQPGRRRRLSLGHAAVRRARGGERERGRIGRGVAELGRGGLFHLINFLVGSSRERALAGPL